MRPRAKTEAMITCGNAFKNTDDGIVRSIPDTCRKRGCPIMFSLFKPIPEPFIRCFKSMSRRRIEPRCKDD